MKAVAVIEQYKNGRRDFRGESLRGCDFKNQDLSGADFSGCDIRGANFSGANLTEVKFEKAKAGLRKRSVVILLFAALILIVISSFFSVFIGIFVAHIFDQSSRENQIAGWASLIFLPFFCLLTWRKNILAGTVAVVTAIAIATVGVVAVAVAIGGVAVSAEVVVAGAALLGMTVAGVAGVVVAGVAGVAVAAVKGGAGIVVTGIVVTGIAVTGIAVAGIAGAGIAGAVTLFFTWIGWLTLKQEHRDPWLRRIIIAFAGLGGTSFFQANLTATDFTGATLKSSNFNQGHWYRLIGG